VVSVSVALAYLTGTQAVTFAGSGSTASSSGALIAFKAGAWTPPAPTGVPVKYASATDTLTTGALFYTSATDTLTTPVEVRPFNPGYADAASMLSGASTSSPFYCAHRGGSDVWPEMSLHAYTQAGFWGVGALELSVSRTSDGVWFGLHDDTLDRTSGLAGGTNLDPSTLTWAQIQASYQISADIPAGQTAKPYMRIEDYCAAYGDSHVTFLDPKNDVAHLTELLDLVDANITGTLADRVVLKYFGVSGMTVPNAAAARGMKTWGYFYQASATDLPTYAGRWDILGMDYSADNTAWTAVTSYGKPVMSHICASPANVTAGTSRGAVGAMVSGVTATITRSA
jgi:hypothetical protein